MTDVNGQPLSGGSTTWTVTDDSGTTSDYGHLSYCNFTPTLGGAYTVTLTATVGGVTGSDSETIYVPVGAAISGPTSGAVGTEVNLTAAATGAGAMDAEMGFTYNWIVTKNGADFTAGGGPDISFTPDGLAAYQVSVVATDYNGTDSVPATANITVAADTISINNVSIGSPEGSFVVGEGDIATLAGNVLGLDGAGFTLSVNWGSNQTSDTLTFPANPDHPLDPRSFTISHHYIDSPTDPCSARAKSTSSLRPATGGRRLTTIPASVFRRRALAPTTRRYTSSRR